MLRQYHIARGLLADGSLPAPTLPTIEHAEQLLRSRGVELPTEPEG